MRDSHFLIALISYRIISEKEEKKKSKIVRKELLKKILAFTEMVTLTFQFPIFPQLNLRWG